MRFRRQADEGSHWVSVTRDGAMLHAVQVTHAEGQRPRVDWLAQLEADDLARGLRQLGRQRGLKGARLSHVLTRAQYRLVSTDAPDMPREEWRDAIRWQLKDQVDFPVDDAVVDLLEVPSDTQARSRPSAIVLIEPQVEARAQHLAADDAGLSWTATEVPETALRNICALGEMPSQAHALLAFGNDHALLVVTLEGNLVMTRIIEVAGAALQGSEEARGGALGRAGLEVLRTLDTFERTHSKVSLSCLSVALPPGTDGMIEALADLLYVPVKAFELAQWVDLSALGEDTQAQVDRLSMLEPLRALGAALRPASQTRGCQQINMQDTSLPQGVVTWGAVWGVRAACAALGVSVLGAVGLSGLERRTVAKAEETEAQLLPMQQASIAIPEPPEVRELAELRKAQAQQRRLRDALVGASADTAQGYSEYLMALGRQAQPSVWITGLVVRSAGRDVELVGRMMDPEFLPGYLGRLQNEAQFKGRRFARVELKTLESEQSATRRMTEFSLKSMPEAVASAPVAAPAAVAAARVADQAASHAQAGGKLP